jgi:hypothetical protein
MASCGKAAITITPKTTATTTPTTTATTPGIPGGGAVINSDSIVTAKIQSITGQSAGYPWKLDVLIQNTVDVGTLPNPVKDSVGKVVTVVTDQNMTSYKVNDVVTAKIKYAGDVNIPGGISLSPFPLRSLLMTSLPSSL